MTTPTETFQQMLLRVATSWSSTASHQSRESANTDLQARLVAAMELQRTLYHGDAETAKKGFLEWVYAEFEEDGCVDDGDDEESDDGWVLEEEECEGLVDFLVEYVERIEEEGKGR